MPLDPDAIVDRRRMRRKLTFWRVGAVAIAIIAIVGFAWRSLPRGGLSPSGDYIARIKVQGLIRNNQERVDALERLARSSARAVIVRVDTPGGTTAGAEQLYDALRQLQEKKPMVVVVDGLAASGGYIAAMAADHIIALDTSIIGSIGVLFQYPNFSDILKTVGIQVEAIRSSPLKAAPSGFEPTSPEARAAIASIVMDSYAWFKGLVQSRRKLDDGLLNYCDGRPCLYWPSGRQFEADRQSRQRKDCFRMAAKEKNIPATTPVRDVALTARFSDLSFLHMAKFDA